MAATKAVNMGGASPLALIGFNPLLKGRKAPAHPAMAPQKMGPKTGKANSLGAREDPAAYVNLTITIARNVSYKKTMAAFARCIPEFTTGSEITVQA